MNQGITSQGLELERLIEREWLVGNGIGGFACSTVTGLNTRRYHGLLVAAMTPPVRRMVLLSRVEETLWCDGQRYDLACNEYPGVIYPKGHEHLRAFSHDPFPRWAYQGDGWTVEKHLRLLHNENTAVIGYTLLGGEKAVDVELRPLFALRPFHELTYQWNGRLLAENRSKRHHRIPATSRTPEVFFAHDGRFESQPNWYLNTIYRREQERGYPGLEDVWNPGVVRLRLLPGHTAYFVCSADPIDFERAIKAADIQYTPTEPAPASDDALTVLRRAADQFVVCAVQEGSTDKVAIAVTDYPWAAPSGRSALVSFTGLMLVTGQFSQAKALLQSFAALLRNGLMPSQLPETGEPPLYHGADISLWFVNAVWNYLRCTNDDATVQRQLLDVVLQIIDAYQHGSELGIGTDEDGLLFTHAPGIATTWMDAKVGEWVVTPRGGRPVELNALWHNAVSVAADLCARFGRIDRSESLSEYARGIKKSFNARFWNEALGCCYDVVEDHGFDPSVRPNQLLTISLPFPVLSIERHARVLEKVKGELLTPFGVRTLSPHDPGYQGRYAGNVIARDRAYHGGSAFPWLLGPFVTSMLRVRGRGEAARREARALLRPCVDRMLGDGLGELCELFDGDEPHKPGGAIASAVSVGELLRCYAEDVLGLGPQVATLVSQAGADAGTSSTPRVKNPA